MAEIEQLFIEVRGCRLHLWRAGSGPPLVYLHGSAGGRWLPYMDDLAHHFTVIAPEAPWFGDSDDADWIGDAGDVAFLILDFLDGEGLSGVHLMGSSIGAWFAAELAIRSTRNLASLMLIGPSGLDLAAHPRPDLFRWTSDDHITNIFYDTAIREKIIASRRDAPPDPEKERRQLRNRNAMARYGFDPPMHNPELKKWLHRIDVPTLLLWGEHDRLVPLAYARAFQSEIPDIRLHVFKACGHLPQQEKRDEFVQVVREFAAQVDG